jgi:hypothetical protein
MALEKIKYNIFKPQLLIKIKLPASQILFILYFLGHQKQSIFKKKFFPAKFSFVFWKREFWREKIYFAKKVFPFF